MLCKRKERYNLNIIHKNVSIALIIVWVLVHIIPLESVLGQYKTPDAVAQAKEMEPILWIHASDKKVAIIVEGTDLPDLKDDKNVYTIFTAYKRPLGWAVRDMGYFLYQDIHLRDVNLQAEMFSWQTLSPRSRIIIIIDTKPHKVTDPDGTPYEQHEFIQGDTKVYAYIKPEIDLWDAFKVRVMIDGVEIWLRDIS
jgi:hypothetical protein